MSQNIYFPFRQVKKLIKRLYNWTKKRMHSQGNPVTIQNWVNWLNANFGIGWFALDGFHLLILEKGAGNGIRLKAFWNRNTGEIKMFDARKFQ